MRKKCPSMAIEDEYTLSVDVPIKEERNNQTYLRDHSARVILTEGAIITTCREIALLDINRRLRFLYYAVTLLSFRSLS